MSEDIKTTDSEVVPTGAVGIKETLDLLNMLDEFLTTYEKAKADGKLDLDDLQYATGAIVAAVEAIKGAENIPTELKELDALEATQIFQKVFVLLQRAISMVAKKDVSVPVIFPVA